MQSVFTKSKATCLLWCFKLEKKKKKLCSVKHYIMKQRKTYQSSWDFY